jgi:hypothetical protein
MTENILKGALRPAIAIALLFGPVGCFSQGTITGKLTLEDGAPPTAATIAFFFNDKLEESVTPNADGTFSISFVKEGVFSAVASAPGYDSQTVHNILSPAAGTSVMEDITLTVTPDDVTITVKDKKGNPFANMALRVSRQSTVTLTTDAQGTATLPNLPFGDYFHDPRPYTRDPSKSFAVNLQDRLLFSRVASHDSYELVLRRVTYIEGENLAASSKPGYVAQSIVPSVDLSVCGAGMAVAGSGNYEIRIHEDDAGQPGKLIASRTFTRSEDSSTLLRTNVDLVLGMVDFCLSGASPILLQGGMKYWMVLGGGGGNYGSYRTLPASGDPLLYSLNGGPWKPDLSDDYHRILSLNLVLTE